MKAKVVAGKRKSRRIGKKIGRKPTTGTETVYVPLWQNSVKQHPHKKVLLVDALGAHFKTKVLRMFHAADTWVCRILAGTTSFLQYLDVYFFAVWKDTLYNILDDVSEILEEAGKKRVSASEKHVLITKAVADAWQAIVEKTAATRPEAFGKLGYTWSQGDVVSLRSLPDYKFDPEEHFEDVCVKGADGANAASSAAVAHASAVASNATKQMKLTSLAVLKSVPSMCSCTVCLGGSGAAKFGRLLNKARGVLNLGGY